MRLPPYGRSIDQSTDLVWIWVGHKARVYEMVKVWGKNTCALFPFLNPKEFHWPIAGRNILIVSFMKPQDVVVKRLVHTLLKSKADQVVELMWRPNGHVIGEENITFTHYQRN